MSASDIPTPPLSPSPQPRRPRLVAVLVTTLVTSLLVGATLATLLVLSEQRQVQDADTARASDNPPHRESSPPSEPVPDRTKDAPSKDRLHSRRAVFNGQLMQATQRLRDPVRCLEWLDDPDACPLDLRDLPWHILRAAAHRHHHTLRVQRAGDDFVGGGVLDVRAVAFSSDGRQLATVSAIGGGARDVQVWDLDTFHSTRLGAIEDAECCLAFSPIGQTLAVASVSGPLRLWDLAAAKELRVLKGHTGLVEALEFSTDGKLLASGDGEQTIVWDVQTGKDIHHLKASASSLAFTADPQLLVTADADDVRLWDCRTGQQLQALKDVGAPIAFHKDEAMLAAVAFAGGKPQPAIQLCTLANKKLTHTGRLRCRQEIQSLAVSPTQKLLAVGFADLNRAGVGNNAPVTVKLLDLATEEEVMSFRGHSGKIARLAFHPSGTLLASLGQLEERGWLGGEQVKLWRIGSMGPRELPAPPMWSIQSAALSPDGRWVAQGDSKGRLAVTDRRSGKILRTLNAHTEDITALAYSPDGLRLATGAKDGQLKIWDSATGQLKHTLAGEKGHRILVLRFAQDGKSLLTANSQDGADLKHLIHWDTATGKEQRRITLEQGQGFRAAALSPDGKQVAAAVGGLPGAIHRWDLTNGQALEPIKGSTAPLSCLAYSPDGRLLASGGSAATDVAPLLGEVLLWDTASGKLRRVVPNAPEFVSALTFSPDSATLAITGQTADSVESSVALFWDVLTEQRRTIVRDLPGGTSVQGYSADGKVLLALGDGIAYLWETRETPDRVAFRQHRQGVLAVALSPDGNRLASGGVDGTILVRDMRTGEKLFSLPGQSAFVTCLAFSPDSKLLAAGIGALGFAGHPKGEVLLCDGATGATVGKIEDTERVPISLAFTSNSDRLIANLDESAGAVCWNVSDRKVLWKLHPAGRGSVVLAGDGKHLLLGGEGEGAGAVVKVWDLATRQSRGQCQAAPSDWTTLALSPDGKLLATANGGRSLRDEHPLRESEIRLFTFPELKPCGRWRAHEGGVTGLTFSPDGRQLISAGMDHLVRRWEVSTGKELPVWRGHTGAIFSLAARGNVVVTGDTHGRVMVWE